MRSDSRAGILHGATPRAVGIGVAPSLVLLLLGASPVLAVTEFGDGVSVESNVFFGSAGGFSSAATSSEVSRNGYPWSASAAASSALIGLTADTVGNRAVQPGFSGYATGRATPSVRLDDLAVSKLPGQEGLPDTLSAQLEIDAVYVADSAGGSTARSMTLQGGINTTATALASYIASASETLVASKILTVGVPFFVYISMDQQSTISGFDGGTATGTGSVTLDASSLLTLPPGYTVYGADGLVTDNRLALQAPALSSGFRLVFVAGLIGCALWPMTRRRSPGAPLRP